MSWYSRPHKNECIECSSLFPLKSDETISQVTATYTFFASLTWLKNSQTADHVSVEKEKEPSVVWKEFGLLSVQLHFLMVLLYMCKVIFLLEWAFNPNQMVSIYYLDAFRHSIHFGNQAYTIYSLLLCSLLVKRKLGKRVSCRVGITKHLGRNRQPNPPLWDTFRKSHPTELVSSYIKQLTSSAAPKEWSLFITVWFQWCCELKTKGQASPL